MENENYSNNVEEYKFNIPDIHNVNYIVNDTIYI